MPKHATLGVDGKVPSAQLPASSGGGAWGSITGTLSDQTDLQSALDTKAATAHNHTGVYAPVLGTDDNYVTDAEKVKLANLSGVNSGDQDLSGYALTSHNHTGIYQPAATVLTNTTAAFTTAQETKLAGIETGATADMTGAEIVSAIDTQLGGSTWQGGGAGGGGSPILSWMV